MRVSDQVFQVSGMTCDHCVAAVTEEVSAVPGVLGIAVDLVPGGVSVVAVSAEGPIDVEAVRAAVDEAGYELVG
jgi:copper chaperone CopZ